MSFMGGAGGTDQSPQNRALNAIVESPNPDAQDFSSAEKTAEILQSHTYQLKELASTTRLLQKGVNDATQNPIQQIQQFISDIVVLLGGGELAEGVLDFGDLQYILPALGALFGFGDAPFPINLLQAAEKLFIGYIVPTRQWTDEVNKIIDAWAAVIGIDPKFMHDVNKLITAVGELFDEVGNLLPHLNSFFTALDVPGVSSGSDLGPLGAILGPIIKFFSGINLQEFGSLLGFVTSVLDPFVVNLTAIINFIDEFLHVLQYPGDVINDPLPQVIVPIKNLMRFLGNVQLNIESFNPVGAVQSWLGSLLIPIAGFSEVQPNLQIDPSFDDSADIGDPADGKNWTRENLDPPVTNGDWVWDLLGRTTAGSATVHANGVDHGLLGTIVYVDEGHTFDFDVYLSWTGLTASTGALALHIQTDTGTNTAIASVTSPGTTGTWTHLAGSYTVPAGVSSIRLRLFVGAGASAGQVWFDDTNIRRTNLIHPGLIQYFEDFLAAIGAGDLLAAGTIVATAISNAATAISNIGSMITGTGGSVITDLVALLNKIQQTIDMIANALGHVGAGFSLTSVQTYLNGVLQHLNSTGQYDATQLTNLASSLLKNITPTGGNIGQFDAAQLTNIANIVAGIPGGRVLGPFSSSVEADLQGLGNALWQIWTGATGNVTGVPQIQSAATSLLGTVDSATSISESISSQLAMRAISKPSYMGVDPSADAVFNITTLAGSSPTTINVTASTSAMGMVATPDGGLKKSIAWLGQIADASTLTAMYINIYQVNLSTGVLTLVHASANILGQITSSGAPLWNYYDLPSPYLDTSNSTPQQANWYAVEMQVVGSGTYKIVGMPNHWLPANGNAYPKQLAATRGAGSAPATIASPTYSSNVPWFAMCGIAGASEHAPVTTLFATPGSGQSYTVPGWMKSGDKFDIVMVGDGGGAGGGFGGGGDAGAWNAITLTYGVDIPLSTTTFTVNVGAGGTAGSAVTAGGSGSGCSLAIAGYGTVSTAGGVGSGSSAGPYGAAAGNETFNGTTYYGGAEDTSGYANAPGGGGLNIGSAGDPRKAGAPGAVWITGYQG